MLESIQSLDDKIAQINETIAQLVVRRCALQARKNEHAFINRCPNEILLSIFRDAHSWEVTTKFRAYPKTLVAVTRVCSRWRNLAYGIPSLWASIDFGYNNGAIRHMLELSRQSGTALRGELRNGADLNRTAATLNHIVQTSPETIHFLQLDLLNFHSVNISSPVMVALMPVPFTQLESLNLSCATEGSMSIPEPASSVFMFPLGGMARLHSLLLAGIHPSYFVPLSLGSLTVLELKSLPIPNNSLNFLKQVAQGCPCLECFTLKDVYGDNDSGSDTDGQVSFPALDTATFSASSLVLLNTLLDHMSINVYCDVALKLTVDAFTPSTSDDNPFTAIRTHTSRQNWSITYLALRIARDSVGMYIYPTISGRESDEWRLLFHIMQEEDPTWQRLQADCRFVWESVPHEKLESVSLEFGRLWDDSLREGPVMKRQAGEQWPVEDVLAALFESADPSLRSLVTDL